MYENVWKEISKFFRIVFPCLNFGLSYLKLVMKVVNKIYGFHNIQWIRVLLCDLNIADHTITTEKSIKWLLLIS